MSQGVMGRGGGCKKLRTAAHETSGRRAWGKKPKGSGPGLCLVVEAVQNIQVFYCTKGGTKVMEMIGLLPWDIILRWGSLLSQAWQAQQTSLTQALFSAAGNMNLKLGTAVYLHISTYFFIALCFIYSAFPLRPYKLYRHHLSHVPKRLVSSCSYSPHLF